MTCRLWNILDTTTKTIVYSYNSRKKRVVDGFTSNRYIHFSTQENLLSEYIKVEDVNTSTHEVKYTIDIEKINEDKWNMIRNMRDNILKATDYFMLSDVYKTLSASEKTGITTYRQNLRDITNSSEDPSNIKIPSITIKGSTFGPS